MVIEAKREAQKNQSSSLSPPKTTPQKNMNKVDSILKSPSKPSVTPQTLPNQYSGNQASVTFSNIGENSINTGTANANIATGNSGEENSDNSKELDGMKGWYNNSYLSYHINHTLCKVSNRITALFTKLNKGLSIADAGVDTHVVGNT